jgi:heme-degrading monooxygenase HmoA
MHARATRLKTSPERIEQGIEHYRSGLAQFREIEGNRGAFLLVDRSSGKGIGVTLWESEDAMQTSRSQADQLRQRAASNVDADIESVDEYEVAVWDVAAGGGTGT